MSQETTTAQDPKQSVVGSRDYSDLVFPAVIAALLLVLYWNAFNRMYGDWTATESYYTHGFLVPLISAFFAWRQRAAFAAAPARSAPSGYLLLALGIGVMLAGSFLGFMIITQLSLLPVLFGISLVLFGYPRTRIMWFPLAFLIFMIPLPGSVTQSFALHLKLFATEGAVILANWATLPMVREGSFIYFGDDQLLVGEVCGGLRSLIALLAFGAVMAYISKTRPWAQWFLLVMSGPIAIIANVFRIFLLCVVGYFWGSEVAAGRFHDISGILIFVVAFALFFGLETQLRRIAPVKDEESTKEQSQ